MWVYIAEMGDGRLYVGVTRDPDRRALEHDLGISIRTTRVFGFKDLLYLEFHPDWASARERERQLKRWSGAKKRALARGDLDELKRLASARSTQRARDVARPPNNG